MRRQALLWAACLLVSAGARAGGWSNLWLTPDQQGQRLLDAGHPARAAQRFEDPRRRAYADLKAHRYTAAAKLLAPFKDPQSEYNRGNALARSGRLRAALDAYDAALKGAPSDRDIRHNRDLVARALRKRHEQPHRQGAGRAQPHHNKRNKGRAKPGRARRGNPHTGGRNGTGGRGKTARPRPQQARPRTGAGSQANAAARPNGPRPAEQQARAARSGHAKAGGHAAAQTGARPPRGGKAGERQAKRDAAAAARLRQRRAKAGADDRPAPFGSATAAREHGSKPPKPPTEKALSLDRWLRRIPDNPAGLLRRKFLIENALRAQRSQQP